MMPPSFIPFAMEEMMSKFEQNVKYNLSESGVHPALLKELLTDRPQLMEKLLETELNYPYVNGNPELRRHIAGMYANATSKNVLVTVGAIEANYIAVRSLLHPGDEIVMMLPNYMQIWGIAKNHNLQIKTFHLREEAGWSPDLNELEEVVSPATKMIAVCNPNNPTGYIMSAAEMDAIVAIAEKVGAWILSDEVYAGAERLTDIQTPSFFGKTEKVLAMGSMSKAYGMPGLRIGWVVAPEKAIEQMWRRHEYTAISATMLSNQLAAIALSPEVRPRILQRTRDYIRQGYPVLEGWFAEHGDTFAVNPPQAAAICFVRYRLKVNSTALSDRLRSEKSVLVVPGDHFGMDHFLRISYGLPHEYLTAALNRINELIAAIRHGEAQS